VGDGAFADRAEQRLKNLVDNSEILIIASHSKSLIEKASSTMLWLDHGNVRELGATSELASQYFG
jgi:lipopolysaccharide transport system ATP-binding protein